MNKKKGHGWVQEVTNQSAATTDLNTFSLQPELSVTYLIPWSQQKRSWSQSATENKRTEENRREGKRLEEKITRQNKREGKVSEGETNAKNRSEGKGREGGNKKKKEEKRVRCSQMHCIYFRETDTKSAIQTFLTQGQFIYLIKTGWRQSINALASEEYALQMWCFFGYSTRKRSGSCFDTCKIIQIFLTNSSSWLTKNTHFPTTYGPINPV